MIDLRKGESDVLKIFREDDRPAVELLFRMYSRKSSKSPKELLKEIKKDLSDKTIGMARSNFGKRILDEIEKSPELFESYLEELMCRA